MQYPEYIPYRRKERRWVFILVGLFVIALLGGLVLFRIPRINRAISWRLDIAVTYISMLFNPVEQLPTPAVYVQPSTVAVSATAVPPTLTPEPTQTPIYTPTPTLVPTPIPERIQLDPPPYNEGHDQQGVNNCGPATLALYLRFYSWEGDQYNISELIKPTSDDRNVNVEELVYYVRTRSGWLNAEFRVGGDLETIKKLVAAGIPVMIEETFETDRQYWPDDDQWAGHYLLITGYDDALQEFTVHDTEIGPNQKIAYTKLKKNWQSFNYVYIMVYPPKMEGTVQGALGENWDPDVNRQNALQIARLETQMDPANAFAWFNLGTNLNYFERYTESVEAYNTARTIGLPQRMLRYQFGPFLSYFHSLQTDELIALTKYALKITRTSEEAMLWRGWAHYRLGEGDTALKYFRDAIKINPGYENAQDAIEFVTNN